MFSDGCFLRRPQRFRCRPSKVVDLAASGTLNYDDDDDDEIAYFTVRWKTRASFVYRTKNTR